jgi:NAD(P)-dependent dehydrogenase (short-subunit alcohol dehydrogenase family)
MGSLESQTPDDRRICVVSGAASGLGAALVRRFASLGNYAVVADRDVRRATDVAESITASGGLAVARHVDVSDEQSVRELAEWLLAEHGRVDVLVNCAGVALAEGGVLEMTRQAWDLTIAVNLTGTFLMCRYLLPLMPPGGAIVNVSTAGVRRTVPGTDAYLAAKGGVISLTKAMAVSLSERGVRCNVVCPGVFATDEVRGRLDDPRVQAMIGRTAPLGRDWGVPDEFATAVEFLCGPAASFINGAEIAIDGGATA